MTGSGPMLGTVSLWEMPAPGWKWRGAGIRLVIYTESPMPDWKERKPSIMFKCDDNWKAPESLKS